MMATVSSQNRCLFLLWYIIYMYHGKWVVENCEKEVWLSGEISIQCDAISMHSKSTMLHMYLLPPIFTQDGSTIQSPILPDTYKWCCLHRYTDLVKYKWILELYKRWYLKLTVKQFFLHYIHHLYEAGLYPPTAYIALQTHLQTDW